MKLTASALHLRTWLTGTRPVFGSLVACAGLVVACSWFGLGVDGFGASTNVDTADPVHLHDQARQQSGARLRTGLAASGHGARGKPIVRSTPRGDARSAPPAAHGRRLGTGSTSRGPLPTEATAPSAPSTRQATAKPPVSTSAPPPPQPAPTTPPSLPDPPVSVPSVPVPTVTVPPPPSVQVPTVPTTTMPLGLP